MVKRSRNQITRSVEVTEESPVDLYEQRCNQHLAKKKKFTVLSDSQPIGMQYVDYKAAAIAFDNISGQEGKLEPVAHFALMADGNIAHIQRAKVIACPALFGGNKICFLGKIFVRATSVNLSSDVRPSEVYETDLYYVILENQIKKDVLVRYGNGPSPAIRQSPKHTYLCRFHYYPATHTTGPVLDNPQSM